MEFRIDPVRTETEFAYGCMNRCRNDLGEMASAELSHFRGFF